MRVLFLNDTPFVRLGIAAGFAELGHDVEFLLPHLWELPAEEQFAVAKARLAHDVGAQLVLYEGFTGTRPISPRAIRLLQLAWGARFHYWAIEDPLWTHEVVAEDGARGPYALVADHVHSTAIECVRRYGDEGLESSLLLFACNPAFHRPVPAEPEWRCDVVLVADHYASRDRSQYDEVLFPALQFCRRYGLEARIYGRGWEGTPTWGAAHGPLPYEQLAHAYGGARVVLGLEQCLGQSETQSSVRIFEALGCGACYLGPRQRAHVALFDDRRDALFSDSAEETEELLAWVLDDEEARRAIALSGRRHCLATHTYAHRAATVVASYATSTRRGAPSVARR